MASRFFIPQSGDYAWDGSVWASTATGAAGSAATPVDGDDVYILNGTARIISSLNQSSVQLNSLTIGFSGEIGTSSASLQIGLDSGDDAHIYGQGTINISIIETTASELHVYNDFTGRLTLGSTTAITDVFLGLNGTCEVASGATIIGAIETAGCGVTIGSSVTIPAFAVLGGNHRSASTIGAMTVHGRSFVTMTGSAAITSYVFVYAFATYTHDSSGTIGDLYLYPHATAVATGRYGGFTVTASTIYANTKLFENSPVAITYTAQPTKVGYR